MMLPTFQTLPLWAMAIGLVLHLAGGVVLGRLYFRAVWWTVRRFAGGGSIATPLLWTLVRFVALAAVLTGIAVEGTAPLLATALGIFAARYWVTRGNGAAAL